jgi:hypothetical protein
MKFRLRSMMMWLSGGSVTFVLLAAAPSKPKELYDCAPPDWNICSCADDCNGN